MKTITIQVSDDREQEVIEKIKAMDEGGGRKRAEYGVNYFYITSAGELLEEKEGGYDLDDLLFKIGNYYLTREEAEKTRDIQLTTQRLKDYALKHMPFKPNYEGGNHGCHIVYNYCKKEFKITYSYRWFPIPTLPVLKDAVDGEKFIADNLEDLKLVFGVR